MNPLRILVVGCGHMGESHAKAYQADEAWEVCGVVSRGTASRTALKKRLGMECPDFADFEQALGETRPDAVCIATYPDTHAPFARMAMEQGCDVFLEKPLGVSVEEARALREQAVASGRKLVVGYILRHHPAWNRFVEEARRLGPPLVMRMSLNQQSSGNEWRVHRNLMQSLSPIVDCGVHYVDVMCRMTRSEPVRVHAIGARLSDEIAPTMYNYGCLQVAFSDGSVGWYEAGWGPMMSQEAYFVKDVVGPRGSISIDSRLAAADSDDVGGHTKTGALLRHFAELNQAGNFARKDEWIDLSDEPDHDALCAREQAYFLRAIREDLDLSEHLRDSVNSLRIVLAADQSIREGRSVSL